MAEAAAPAQSESMEDILHSIKRIIEDEPGEKKAEGDVLDLTQTVAPEPKAAKPAAAAPAVMPSLESIVSEEAANAAAAALKPIVENTQKDFSIPRVPSPELRGGNTVEDLLLEAMRPMLKSWLDEHLPLIVQRIVEKEIKRIVTFRQD